MTTLKNATDNELFAELDKCKIAKVLLSKSAFAKTWTKYQEAIKTEIKERNKIYEHYTDNELLAELFF
jgi:hypothetical protein